MKGDWNRIRTLVRWFGLWITLWFALASILALGRLYESDYTVALSLASFFWILFIYELIGIVKK